MGANIAGIYGAQIFRADDKPRYRRGFSIAISVLAVGLLLAILRKIDEWWGRRKGKNIGALQAETGSSGHNSLGDGDLKGKVGVVEEQPEIVGIDDRR